MNYLLILTEISFYPETSILLQTIRNKSYDISDINQNLTDTVGSLPVLNSKGTTRSDSKENPLEPEGAHGTPSPLFLKGREWEPTGPTKPTAIS